jgi:hypothetical protein
MLPRTPGLDQPAVSQQSQVMADRGLALAAQIGAKFGHVPLFFVQKH